MPHRPVTPSSTPADTAREAAVEAALARLDLPSKTRLLAGQDMWTIPAFPEIGLESLVMSDGPIGVRGTRWTAADPSIALPSPTALAASWDPELARRTGRLLAQEARRKGVHVLLAPTVNLHRSPLGGRHFETYSEDPYLTGVIGSGYVRGVQEGGVGTTVKHFVANDAETDRFTANNILDARTLRELYLAPFEAIVENAHPWGIMCAYNSVNGTTMSEHRYLQNEVLRGEWGFDGYIVSDWTAGRDTKGAIEGGLDVAMPGPRNVYGPALEAAVAAGEVAEETVDEAVRNVLRLAARVGIVQGAEGMVAPADLPAGIDGEALAREVARRGFTLVRNHNGALPLTRTDKVALIGLAGRDARVLGGGSATVFPTHVTSPLEGLRAALPADSQLTYSIGNVPSTDLDAAEHGFDLTVTGFDAAGDRLGTEVPPIGAVQWFAGGFPDGIDYANLHSAVISGTFTPRVSGAHRFGTKGLGVFKLTVDGTVLFDGEVLSESDDPFTDFFAAPREAGVVELAEGKPVEVSLEHVPYKPEGVPMEVISFTLAHLEPSADDDTLIAEAVAAARAADSAVVVVSTTAAVESEGFDRTDLRLPGRQDDLVAAVAAANPNTVVVVNAGSPVEMPWRDSVAAVLLTWFPGQEGGSALADVLLGAEEPGGRLPTTWPVRFADAPVTEVAPRADGTLPYDEGLFIGYRAWEKRGVTPAFPFGHGLGYTDWAYESIDLEGATARIRVRNTGTRTGREVVQVYLAPVDDTVQRPVRWLAGFASVTASPGESVEVAVELPRRAFEIWDEAAHTWTLVPGSYEVQAGRSIADRRLTAALRA
ncbi:glycoside hydrolase family 3 protein [Streptomyces sp. NPDC059373]